MEVADDLRSYDLPIFHADANSLTTLVAARTMGVGTTPALRVTNDPTFKLFDKPPASAQPELLKLLLTEAAHYLPKRPKVTEVVLAEEYDGPWANVLELRPDPIKLPELQAGEKRVMGNTLSKQIAPMLEYVAELHVGTAITIDKDLGGTFGVTDQRLLEQLQEHVITSIDLGDNHAVIGPDGKRRLVPKMPAPILEAELEVFVIPEDDPRVGLGGGRGLRTNTFIPAGTLVGLYTQYGDTANFPMVLLRVVDFKVNVHCPCLASRYNASGRNTITSIRF